MHTHSYIHRLVNLIEPSKDILFNMTSEEAAARVRSGDWQQIQSIQGQFAICAQDGRSVLMARSIGRPMRYFLAKKIDGPMLVVAERIDEIRRCLEEHGIADQFHPSYTRMVPAHHVVRIELIGCPDPNPRYDRFFTPQRETLPCDLDAIGSRYVMALDQAIDRWLDRIGKQEPLGVLFSGGIDSGAVLLTLYHRLLARGESPSRLKAFTLRVDGDASDADQAIAFVQKTGLEMLLEIVDVSSQDLDWKEAVRTIEDYKSLDVQAATMALGLCRAVRQRYPDWKYLIDGDGGDENLKDYPIEENSELTIRSVLNNLMLYQEGWGVHAIKHSLVYSGGQSRGHVRSFAPASQLGFEGFSPFAVPSVIEVAEAIPFISLTDWSHEKLYALKGEIVRRGIKQVCGIDMPTFEKRRFQHGAVTRGTFDRLFPVQEEAYREYFLSLWGTR